MFWNDSYLLVFVIYAHAQFIHAKVLVLDNLFIGYVMAIYKSLNIHNKKQFWDGFSNIIATVTLSQAMFNAYIQFSNKLKGAPPNLHSMLHFHEYMQNYCLLDLGFQGLKYT